jgi:vancomycin resistance protein YoaR
MRWWPRKKVYIDNLPKTHDVRFAVLFMVGLVAVFGALYGVGHLVAGNTVPRGTTVSDVDIGTLTRGEAETTLREELVPRLERPITLESPRGSFRIDPQETGLTLDVEATVEDAMAGGDWDPRHMLQVVFGGNEIEPVVHLDEAEFRAQMDPIVQQVRIPATDSRVLFTGGRPQVRFGNVGSTVDLERLRMLLTEALHDNERTVRLPMRPVEPHITSEEAEAFVKAVAVPAATQPVQLTARGSDLVVEPAGFAAAFVAAETPEGLRLDIDPAAAYALGAPARRQLPGQPTDAGVVLRNGRPVVVPGRPGYRITPQAWAAGVLDAAQRRPGRRAAVLTVEPAPPAFTTEEARAMRIRGRVASFAVSFPASLDAGSVAAAVRRLDGAVLRPGARLSFLARVRPAGQAAASTVVATATYNTALLAGLEVLERFGVPRVTGYLPLGREALVGRPARDLVLENRMPYGVLLDATAQRTQGGGRVRVDAWSSRYWQVRLRESGRRDVTSPPPIRRSGPRCQPQRGTPGFTIDVTRLRQRGDQRRTDVFGSRYVPVRGVVCRGPGS